ncbi:MAG TPA: glycogen debranching N-terminal domain-containing protein [Galbitalea sp.]|jgi:glycogen debranching enzyme
MTKHRQPLLSEQTVVLRAPAQAWSEASGAMGGNTVDGLYVSDVRIVSVLGVTYDGVPGELIATEAHSADTARFVSVLRTQDDDLPDPRIRAVHERAVRQDGATETITIASTLDRPVTIEVVVSLASDLADMDAVKSGTAGAAVDIRLDGESARWSRGAVSADAVAPGARISAGETLTFSWMLEVPAKGSASASWSVRAEDSSAVVVGASTPADWATPGHSGDDRLDRWLARALVDLEALRMSPATDSDAVFLAAGAPWFFTLFGRDSIWAARLMLPLGGRLAADTLRVLASMQGTKNENETAEQPGKIMHELRRQALQLPSEGVTLPPLYYGTVDATSLWVCLLHDAWRAGMTDREVEALLPNLTAALEWMRDYGDADGDGLLEYIDTSGHGLTNQGWKDSGDSVQWRNGTLAEGPIALCEVQGYAYEAALHGADLLEHFGRDGREWREWASRLRARFNESFWIEDAAGAYPAIALDVHKRPVDTVTSNMGHLLGTGLLDEQQGRLIAARLVSPELSSGYGLRTMSTDAAGYWPLSYHGGSVWAHDTAIAVRGLAIDGHADAAAVLTEGLLAAAASFDYRMPELHSGDPATEFSRAIPYPAACRPQAWSAAAAVAVWAARQ